MENRLDGFFKWIWRVNALAILALSGGALLLLGVFARDLRILAAGIDGFLGLHQPSDSTALVFYAKGGVVRVMDIDLASRSLRNDVPLSVQD
ncbi:MAG TPA: hypothetical protein DCY89_00345 [Gammaproteobacteria bacterium]|nr:hypothetical protein [Gammaproteobacteria bacterium]